MYIMDSNQYAIELVTYLLVLVVYFYELIVYVLLERNAFNSIAFFSQCMVSIFWDAHRLIFIEYLEKGRTITGAYYAALLD